MKFIQSFLIRAACNSWRASTSILSRFLAIGVLVFLLTGHLFGHIHLPYLNSVYQQEIFNAHETFEKFLSVFATSVICQPF